jgi:ankyrin repeat protein
VFLLGPSNPTSFLDAAQLGDLEKIKTLLNDNPDLVFSEGSIALQVAVGKGFKEMAELLRQRGVHDYRTHGVEDKTPETTSILEAAQKGNLKDVKHWISQNPKCVSVRENDYLAATPLHLAATRNYKEIVDVLLAHGAEVNVKDGNGWTPLHFAAERGYRDVVESLLNHGGINCTNKQGRTPSQEAKNNGHHDLAAFISGCAQKLKPKESVHAVAEKGDLKTLEKMIADDPALVSATDEDRKTPLHRAANQEAAEVAELLLSKGADPRAQDKTGCTPLHIAAMNGHERVVAVLLSKGSDVNAKGEGGWTPLRFATYMGRDDVVELLRHHGGR